MASIGKKIKENETKREKFVRLAENRMNYILKHIDLLSNLSNKSTYDYNQADVEKIIKTLKNSVADLEKSFNLSNNINKNFKL